MPIKHKKITSFGVKPLGKCNFERESFWIYGATDILSGDSYYWDFNEMSKNNFKTYIESLSENYSDSLNVILIDNAKIHLLDEIPKNIVFINFPPYNPELNPEERVWEYFKSDMGYRIFEDIDNLKDFVYEKLLNTKRKTIKSIVSYSYIIEAAHALNFI
jgi:transposase